MAQLHERLTAGVRAWRERGYETETYPGISEILDWAREPETGVLRFLRSPQIQALETYWYLRLVESTPHALDLYRKSFPKLSELLGALGLEHPDLKTIALDEGVEKLWERISSDDDFVRDFRLEALRETLTLAYPSYILALAMGAGKTILIGAIIATEFAMALEYPEGPFVQNALVFAPGTTILESLRELAQTPYEKILPPRAYKPFAAAVKLTFTRDGEKDIPVIRGSSFNVVVTNTEKIRIQKETIRKSDLRGLFAPERQDEARSEVANLRLQAIASLPHLAVFSDEAHHTYGQTLDAGLKKVRKTVDYLAAKTNLVCVINTTGTPYFQRQPLKDVVIWYGLSEGIRDGILKDLSGNIHAYDFGGDARVYVAHVVEDFFRDYGDIRLPNGAPAKLAIYFPQTEDLKELKPIVDRALLKVGGGPALGLVNTSDSALTKQADIDAFNRLNDPSSPHRVILLVNKGTEGWNCPSLFACALARRLKTSNNFVLQAATRCLRQVPGNTRKARVYLSTDNFNVLDRQLQETYGESIEELNRTGQETQRTRIVLRKLALEPLVVTQIVRTVTRKEKAIGPLRLAQPAKFEDGVLRKNVFTLAEQEATRSVLQPVSDALSIETDVSARDCYFAAVDLSARYRLDPWMVLGELRRIFGNQDVPTSQMEGLYRQIEDQTRFYEVREEKVDKALALVRPEGFTKETDSAGTEIYTAEIVYPKERESLLLHWTTMKGKNPGDFGFHYTPYNFDSNPEKSFFETMLNWLNLRTEEVEDIYFTGALTGSAQTDFSVEYKDDKGKWRRYTPDFLVRKKPDKGGRYGSGKVCIVEIKAERDRSSPREGETGRKALAVRKWQELDPARLRYEMVFTPSAIVTSDQTRRVRDWLESKT